MKQVYSGEITIQDIIKAVPKVKPKIEAMKKKVIKLREKREKMSEAEKFALNLPPECSLEDEVFLRLGIKVIGKNGDLQYTGRGFNLAMAVRTVLHERKHRKVEKMRKEKAKKRRKQEKKNKKRNK
jgi:hypothetical protein